MREVVVTYRVIVGSSRRVVGHIVSGCKFIVLQFRVKMLCNGGRVKGGLFVLGKISNSFVFFSEFHWY